MQQSGAAGLTGQALSGAPGRAAVGQASVSGDAASSTLEPRGWRQSISLSGKVLPPLPVLLRRALDIEAQLLQQGKGSEPGNSH